MTGPLPPAGRGWVAWLCAGVVVALVVAGSVWAVLARDPADAPQVQVVPLEEGLPALIHHVEQARGLTFETEPVVEALPEDAYERRVRADFDEEIDEDRDRLLEATDFYAALGLIDGDVDIVTVLADYFSSATLGFYDPESDELVVRGDQLTPGLRVTIVHELTHALDDQRFDLDRPQYDDRDDEVGSTFSALSEGDASRIERLYVAAMSPVERKAYFAEQAAALPDLDISAIPPILLAEERLRYIEGQAFTETVADAGGNAAVDRAFRDPPTTSEEIIDPSVYLEGQEATDPEPPEADGAVVDRGVAGQFILDLLATGEVGGDGPEWSGDRFAQWEEGGARCVRIRYADAGEGLAESLREWADAGPGRAVTVEDGTVLVTGCHS